MKRKHYQTYKLKGIVLRRLKRLSSKLRASLIHTMVCIKMIEFVLSHFRLSYKTLIRLPSLYEQWPQKIFPKVLTSCQQIIKEMETQGNMTSRFCFNTIAPQRI